MTALGEIGLPCGEELQQLEYSNPVEDMLQIVEAGLTRLVVATGMSLQFFAVEGQHRTTL